MTKAIAFVATLIVAYLVFEFTYYAPGFAVGALDRLVDLIKLLASLLHSPWDAEFQVGIRLGLPTLIFSSLINALIWAVRSAAQGIVYLYRAWRNRPMRSE